MSQLETILAELKKSLKNTEDLAADKEEVSPAEQQKASSALKEFLNQNAVELQLVDKGSADDPQVVLSRRKAISDFVGQQLQNDGNATLSGVIEGGVTHKTAHGHGKHQHSGPHEKGIAGAPCPKCRAREIEDERARTSASGDSSGIQSGSNGNGDSKKSTASADTNKSSSENADKSSSSTQAAKSGVAAFFAAAIGGKKDGVQSEQDRSPKTESAKPEPPTKITQQSEKPQLGSSTAGAAKSGSSTSIIWFKHIQAVESALRIQDLHFADSLLALLTEAAASVQAQSSVSIRLKSLQARILIERKLYEQAEEMLMATIKSMEGTPQAKEVCAAYCYRALAQSFQLQNKADKAVKAKEKSIAIATGALGANDPETMLFKEPLAS